LGTYYKAQITYRGVVAHFQSTVQFRLQIWKTRQSNCISMLQGRQVYMLVFLSWEGQLVVII